MLDWWYVAVVTTDVGSGIRQARHLRGWTQHELALAIGQHPNSISRWERGPVRPSVDVVAKISRATGVSADFLLGLTSDPEPAHKATRP
jgi:transcriptional regulator with XRE-family HTH domain